MTTLPNRRALLVAAAGAALGGSAVMRPVRAEARVIRVVARKFRYEPEEVRARLGEALRFEFSAPEVAMGVAFADFQRRADIAPGRVAVVEFSADKVGTFGFDCDVFCGSGHEEMSGTLIIEG